MALLLTPMFLASCNDWLDVRPDTEQKEKDQFSTEKGFKDALIGCYMQMAGQDAYGLRLTLTSVENLANLWRINPNTTRYGERDLSRHDYTTDNAKSTINSIYTSLFKTISQANLIIKNGEGNTGVFREQRVHDVVLGCCVLRFSHGGLPFSLHR